MDMLTRVKEFAYRKHKFQKDDNGIPYLYHLIEVANLVAMVSDDYELICAAYLHDTLEDTNTTYEELQKEFGLRVANLVYEVTHEGTKDEVGYYFPRLKSKEAIILKFADRLSNLTRMQNWDEKRREHYLKKSKFWNSDDKKRLLSERQSSL